MAGSKPAAVPLGETPFNEVKIPGLSLKMSLSGYFEYSMEEDRLHRG